MRITQKTVAAVILASLLSLCFSLPVASALGATEVILNQATLNASTPYWVNGTTAAVAYTDSWNAYFDAGTSTLTLRDASVDQYKIIPGYSFVYALIQANGDLAVELTGSSSLTERAGLLLVTDNFAGMYTNGILTVQGSGSLDFVYDGVAQAFAVYSEDNLYWLGGTYRCRRSSGYLCGLNSRADLLIAGGNITIQGEGAQLRGVTADQGHFRMTGGTVQCRLISLAYDAYALHAITVEITGGNGLFSAIGSNESYGIRHYIGTASITGGCFTFIGEEAAMICSGEALPPDEPAPGMTVLVSETVDGAGALWWYTSADGLLGSIERYIPYSLTPSPFHYIRLCAPAPQTGDGSRPWLWAGIALLSLLSAAGPAVAVRGRRHS